MNLILRVLIPIQLLTRVWSSKPLMLWRRPAFRKGNHQDFLHCRFPNFCPFFSIQLMMRVVVLGTFVRISPSYFFFFFGRPFRWVWHRPRGRVACFLGGGKLPRMLPEPLLSWATSFLGHFVPGVSYGNWLGLINLDRQSPTKFTFAQ